MSAPRYACALFDLDGTLTDPKEGVVGGIQAALGQLGIAAPEGNMDWVIGPPLHESIGKILGTTDRERIWEVVDLYREGYAAGGKFQNVVYPGIPECLARLQKSGVRLFVATAKTEIYAREIIDHFDLARYFVRVHGSALDGTRTVKGDLIRYLLDQEGLDPNAVVMVGDRKHDVIGAKRCGMACAAVLWGYGSREELTEAGADALIPTPADLVAWMLG